LVAGLAVDESNFVNFDGYDNLRREDLMKNLFLIHGASATGKSDLLKWVTENNADDVSFVVKGTTRAQREYERDDPEILLDLNFKRSQWN
jgi:hypothetical protein